MSLSLNILRATLNGTKNLVSSPKQIGPKKNKEVVRSSHPPLENITIKYQGFEVVATPFRKPSNEDKPVKKVI